MNANEGVRQFLAKRNDKENITITGHKMNKFNVNQKHTIPKTNTLDLDQSITLIPKPKRKMFNFHNTNFVYTLNWKYTLPNTQTKSPEKFMRDVKKICKHCLICILISLENRFSTLIFFKQTRIRRENFWLSSQQTQRLTRVHLEENPISRKQKL